MRRSVHRILRSLGLHVERHRDLYIDVAGLVRRPVRCVIDGGAYDGGISRTLLKLFPAADVHSFEPQPDLFARLADESRANPRWHVHNLALSDTERETVFHVPAAAFTASLLQPDQLFGATKTVTVITTTLDAWASRQRTTPDLLKLDLQGSELDALRGASTLMPGVQAVAVEVNFEPRYEGAARFGEVVGFLEDAGFYHHRLYEINRGELGRWRFADALFVRR